MDQELWRRLGAVLRRRGMSYADGLEMMAKRFLNNAFDEPYIPKRKVNAPTRAELHQLLDEIIENGTRHISAIQQNLELLAFALRMVGTRSTEELRHLRKRLDNDKPPSKKAPKKKAILRKKNGATKGSDSPSKEV